MTSMTPNMMEYSGADDFDPIDDYVNSGGIFSMPSDLTQQAPVSQISWGLAPQQQQHPMFQHDSLSHQQGVPQIHSPTSQPQVVRRESSSQSSSSQQHSPQNTQAGSSASQHQPELTETFFGFIKNTKDALHLMEACLQGKLRHVSRRPHDKERDQIIRSGSIFVYEEGSAGIKRWTDGMNWSPSRILGNFLVYRELLKPFPPGEKKKAKKVSKKASAMTNGLTNGDQRALPGHSDDSITNEMLRDYVGSLVDSYDFKAHGLVKKTISVSYMGVQHHIVSYYSLEDVMAGKLDRVIDNEMLLSCYPRPDLIDGQSYRNPIGDELNEGTAFASMNIVPGMMPHMPMHSPDSQLLQGYPMGTHDQMAMSHHGLPGHFMPPTQHQALPPHPSLEQALTYVSQSDPHAHDHRVALEQNHGHFTSHDLSFPGNVYAGAWQY